MPWDRKQSIAILLEAQRSGNKRLEGKARSSLRGKKAPKRKKR